MSQSTYVSEVSALHVAIIMDGNGRWATARGFPRLVGHRRGADAVRRAVEAAPGLGITTLTLFAFSGDNWRRPPTEVAGLMALFERYLRLETPALVANGVRLSVLGRRDRLTPRLRVAIAAAEAATAEGRALALRLAVDYSARDAILRAARTFGAASVAATALADLDRSGFTRRLAAVHGGSAPDVDLLIRTGGEQRLSDFLLWESAYAELYFTPQMWPDFGAQDIAEALRVFRGRERRFGALPVSEHPS
jgi:undecaprenyl diphosphate synthase